MTVLDILGLLNLLAVVIFRVIDVTKKKNNRPRTNRTG